MIRTVETLKKCTSNKGTKILLIPQKKQQKAN